MADKVVHGAGRGLVIGAGAALTVLVLDRGAGLPVPPVTYLLLVGAGLVASLASSLGPANGSDRKGPTALLQSVARVDSRLMPNGCALNLRFDPQNMGGEKGTELLAGLIRGYFAQRGMQMQFNIIDPDVLEDARCHPGKYPGLVVRVAGYCAYFDDLPSSAKVEIISRTRLRVD